MDYHRSVYFDNAPMVREFRTQLRGNKAPWIIAVYLGLLMFMAVIVYTGVSLVGNRSLSQMQGSLNAFYFAIVGMLEFLVAIIAPVIAASSIVGEYDRKSVELIFTSPIGVKYFLVGKLVSSYRYLLVLISLALPMAAIAVVLGGATWQDVLSSFVVISMHGLFYMAISLPIAVLTAKSVVTVLFSYLATFVWVNIMAAISFPALASAGGNVPLSAGLCPYMTGAISDSSSQIGSLNIPIWLSTVLITLLAVKLLVLGAGSALTRAASKETLGLRIHGLIYSALLGSIVGMSSGAAFSAGFGSLTASSWLVPIYFMSLTLVICLPYICIWNRFSESKYYPNGLLRIRYTFRGTPASGLAYLMSLLLTAVIAGQLASFSVGGSFVLSDLFYVFGLLSFWFLAWSLGWASSALFSKQGVESARRVHILLIFCVYILPILLLLVVDGALSLAGGLGLKQGWTQDFLPLRFMFDGPKLALIKAIAFLVLGGVLMILSERKRLEVMRMATNG